MAHISIRNLTVEFKVYGSNSRSMKKQILSQATGGRIAKGADDAMTVKALDNVSLEIGDGERIGLVGHNGAGKSTLLRTLAGIYKPTGGSIEIDGTVGTLIDPAAGMDPEATGVENIYLRGFVIGLGRSEIARHVDYIAEFTELGEFLSLPLKTYSLGMHARLTFAISTLLEPDILLVDEGLGAADANFQQKISEKTFDMFGIARILIHSSHNINYLESVADRLITLKNGKVSDCKMY